MSRCTLRDPKFQGPLTRKYFANYHQNCSVLCMDNQLLHSLACNILAWQNLKYFYHLWFTLLLSQHPVSKRWRTFSRYWPFSSRRHRRKMHRSSKRTTYSSSRCVVCVCVCVCVSVWVHVYVRECVLHVTTSLEVTPFACMQGRVRWRCIGSYWKVSRTNRITAAIISKLLYELHNHTYS